jgi:putative membrane protein
MVVAQMLDGDRMDDGWWWVMGVGWLVLLAAFVVLAVVLVRHFTQTSGTRHGAEEVLAERFARGEIDEEEFRSRRDALRT